MILIFCDVKNMEKQQNEDRTVVAIGQISTMGKVLQQRRDDGRTGTIARCYKGREEDCSPVSKDSRFMEESFTKEGSPEQDPSPVAVSP